MMKECKDCQKGNCSMHDKEDSMEPKVVEISVSKQGISPVKDDAKMAVKKKILGDIKGMALKAMKDNMSMDNDIEDAMDKAPSNKKEEVAEGEEEVEMLPENPGDSKKERLVSLLKEMEDLKERVRQMIEE